VIGRKETNSGGGRVKIHIPSIRWARYGTGKSQVDSSNVSQDPAFTICTPMLRCVAFLTASRPWEFRVSGTGAREMWVAIPCRKENVHGGPSSQLHKFGISVPYVFPTWPAKFSPINNDRVPVKTTGP